MPYPSGPKTERGPESFDFTKLSGPELVEEVGTGPGGAGELEGGGSPLRMGSNAVK